MQQACSYTERRSFMRWVSIGATCAIAALIAYLTLTPHPHTSVDRFFAIDKLYHFVAFAALMLPSGALSVRKWAAALLAASLYGGGIELVQPFFGRSASVLDFVADCAGAVCGLVVARAVVECGRRFAFFE